MKTTTAFAKLPDDIKKQFEDLVCRLSPENLSCDGEITRSEANAKFVRLTAKWEKLERQIGFKVAETDVWSDITGGVMCDYT